MKIMTKKRIEPQSFGTVILSSCLFFLLGCGGPDNSKFIGDWIVTGGNEIVTIEKSGDNFILTKENQKFPATSKKEGLEVSDNKGNSIIIYDENRKHIIYSGNEFEKFTQGFFEGKWKLVRGSRVPGTNRLVKSFLDIKKVGENIEVNYKSELDIFDDNNIQTNYDKGILNGDYYGDKKNVTIRIKSPTEIYFSINPFAEFETINNDVYERTNSSFIVFDAKEYYGVWKCDKELGKRNYIEIYWSNTQNIHYVIFLDKFPKDPAIDYEDYTKFPDNGENGMNFIDGQLECGYTPKKFKVAMADKNKLMVNWEGEMKNIIYSKIQ